jgi:hypothetical protein
MRILIVIVAFGLLALSLTVSIIYKQRGDVIAQQQTALCVAANQEHRIIRNALIASLTEPDVQANAPQRRAYEKIVRRFAEPMNCH